MTQTKIQGKFYPLTESIAEALRKAKLSAAEWRIWSYLIVLNPFGDRYEDFDYLSVMSVCECSKTTMWRAFAKFQEFNIFDFQSRGICVRTLTGASQLQKPVPETEPDTDPPKNDSIHSPKPKPKPKTQEPPETSDYPEISDPWDDEPISEMKSPFQNCNNDFKNETESSKMKSEVQNCNNEVSKPPSNIQSTPPQTLQSYSDFKRSLSEDERENFFNYVKEKTKNLRQPINDLEAWLASKNAANQNRWFVYYQNYQKHIQFRNPQDNQISNPSRRQKISQWQEHLRQEKLAAARLQEESRRLQKSAKQSQTEHITSSPSVPRQSKTDLSSDRQINRNQGRKILRDLDLRQRLENSQDRDQGGES